jgi:DNA polymerase I-like protein with 3'-5' exonuclease and polymerase domains
MLAPGSNIAIERREQPGAPGKDQTLRTLVFDIETADKDLIHSYGPGFYRLGAYKWAGDDSPIVVVTTNAYELVDAINKADVVTGANICNYDLVLLAKYFDLDYERTCAKSFDTQIVEMHLNPVAAKGMQPRGYYGLDATARRYGVRGKSDHIQTLARKHGGFDKIPLDDPEYRSYLVNDVFASEWLYLAQREIYDTLPDQAKLYIRREHRVAAAMGRISLEGFRLDRDETLRRYNAGQARLEKAKQRMHEQYGMPKEGAAPHRTNLGKAAFRRALISCNISEDALQRNWPMNKDGSLATGKQVLTGMIEVLDKTRPQAAELCRVILAMNGERTVYGTALDWAVGDRVHPQVSASQSSGRWSVQKPGITVMGKRGGKAVERGIYLADEGDVLVAIDADQIDARMIAVMSGDKEYAKLFEPGMDLHSEVAWRVFQRPECRAEMDRNGGRCDCEWRDRAKIAGHGWNYGAQPNGLANQLGIPLEVAQQFDAGMKVAFPRLCEWKEETRAAAGAMPYGVSAPEDDAYRVLVNPFGRPVRVERNRAFTQACAQLGQSATRDAMAQAILNLPPHIRRRIRAVIHDEIVLSLPDEGAQELAQKIADSMAFEMSGIRIGFGCSRVSRQWSGCYGAQYETAA